MNEINVKHLGINSGFKAKELVWKQCCSFLTYVVSLPMYTQEFVSCHNKPKFALSRQPLSYNGERFMGKNYFQSGFHKIILN